jgi:peroxiredoxin
MASERSAEVRLLRLIPTGARAALILSLLVTPRIASGGTAGSKPAIASSVPDSSTAAPTHATCPVCAVKEGHNEKEKVKATSVYDGRTYYLCSAACKKAFDADPASYAEPLLPRPAPAFRAATLAGDSVSNERLRGKVVLLDFWATWCAPCVKSMPELQKLSDDYGQRGLVVLGLSTDEAGEKKVRSFVTSKGIRYPIALDDGEPPAWLSYRVVALPAAFLIDRQGRIVRQWTGRADAAEMRAAVEALVSAGD